MNILHKIQFCLSGALLTVLLVNVLSAIFDINHPLEFDAFMAACGAALTYFILFVPNKN